MADLIRSGNIHSFRIDGKAMQLPCNNLCLQYAMSSQNDWIFLIDVDEFLRVRSDRTLEQILNEHEEHPAVSIHWRLFGSSGQ